MTSTVRLVYYILDPYTGAREVVAAQLREGAHARVLRASSPMVPVAARGAVDRVLVDLEADPGFDTLPIGVGPQVVTTEPSPIPANVQDPGAWVQETLLRRAA